ncbi:MAG: inositol monophosphatase [Lachnospiraceae bacterium]|nr:inositol monophosphatase [Lachnospiraceae bacterium]
MELFEQAKEIVLEAGRELLDRKGAMDIQEKSETDFVTAVDLRVQSMIFERLLKLDPSVQLMGEEKDNRNVDPDGRIWILDPVDGTTNFIHDFHHSVISLAYVERRETMYGIVYSPYSGEVFEAWKGKGAWCSGKRMNVSKKSALAQCLISTGTAPARRDRSEATFLRMKRIFDRCQDIRRIGSGALELCYVACGRLDGFYEEVLKPWDYAAGQLMIREAGGIAEVMGEGFLAGTPGIMEELRQTLDDVR